MSEPLFHTGGTVPDDVTITVADRGYVLSPAALARLPQPPEGPEIVVEFDVALRMPRGETSRTPGRIRWRPA